MLNICCGFLALSNHGNLLKYCPSLPMDGIFFLIRCLDILRKNIEENNTNTFYDILQFERCINIHILFWKEFVNFINNDVSSLRENKPTGLTEEKPSCIPMLNDLSLNCFCLCYLQNI